ncbi:MAG: glutaredoxin family protein [Chloroflexi bacterium]|nr:glutaredoxin family protein [Chloroflexota bacterium]
MVAPLPDLILYSRPGCHLCEDANAIVGALLARRAETGLPVPLFVDRNIEDDASWHRRYLTTIPVLAIGGSELELATSTDKVSRFLAEALDGAAPR